MKLVGDIVATLLVVLSCATLWFAPSSPPLLEREGTARRARVLSVDDSGLQTHGLLKFGTQQLTVGMLEGPHKGKTFRAVNEIRAQMELDKQFKPGDQAVVIEKGGENPATDTLVARDHWRLGWIAPLFVGVDHADRAIAFVLFCELACDFGQSLGPGYAHAHRDIRP